VLVTLQSGLGQGLRCGSAVLLSLPVAVAVRSDTEQTGPEPEAFLLLVGLRVRPTFFAMPPVT